MHGDFFHRRTLSDLKVFEWAALLWLLYSVRFQAATDSWIWTIDSSSSFSVNLLWMTWWALTIKHYGCLFGYLVGSISQEN